MGVRTCRKIDCKDIMCDVYIPAVGYICGDCIEDFRRHLEKYEINCSTKGEYTRELTKFIEVSKNVTDSKEVSFNEFFYSS